MEENELGLIKNILEQGRNEEGEYCRLHCILDEEDLKAIEKLKKEYEEADEVRFEYIKFYRQIRNILNKYKHKKANEENAINLYTEIKQLMKR